jgi:hypothetical protein
MRKLSTLIVLLFALGAAAAAAAAQSPVVGDCVAHGQLTQTYSAGELKTGLSTMSADIKEYTDCYDVIQRALLNEVGKSNPVGSASGSGSGGSFLPTPVIVALVLLALGVVTFGAIAVRRRGTPPEQGGGPPDDQ